MRSFEQRFGAVPEEPKLAKEDIGRQRLEAIYNSAIMETEPAKIIAKIEKALAANEMSKEDIKKAPELQRLWDENIGKLPN